MEQQTGAVPEESEQAAVAVDEQRAREREALRRRVRESLLLCPDRSI
jgi:hypothetical protein